MSKKSLRYAQRLRSGKTNVLNFKGWDIKKLQKWLRQPALQENYDFDLKEKIPDDEKGKIRLKREFCGFANQKGGFLLFGIDKKKRIVGVEKNDEFGTRLGQILITCNSSHYKIRHS